MKLRTTTCARALTLTVVMSIDVAGAIGGTLTQAIPSECEAWAECQSRALEAEATADYERFHDLAWRTMQKRGRQDPDIMLMLARAQALSGRPHDGLVMLRRVAESGFAPTEALTSDTFARTRALAEWPEVERLISSVSIKAAPPADGRSSTRAPGPDLAAGSVSPGRATSPAGGSPRPESGPVTPPPAAGIVAEETLRFPLRDIVPAGLAHDVASGRVLLGNRLGRSVITISERLKTAMDLVRSDSAGFLDVLAIAIDARRGDLWVASARGSGAGDSMRPSEAALHKLQLVSGRPLFTVPIDNGDQPVHFTGLTVTSSGAVFVLDRTGSRVWKLAGGAKEAALVATLDLTEPAALAVDERERHLYIAHPAGLSRVTATGAGLKQMSAPEGVDLSTIESLNWFKGSLVGIERGSDGHRRLMRWHLNSGGTAIVRTEVIDPAIPTAGVPGTATLSGDDIYYLAAAEPIGSGEPAMLVVRRARLQ